MRRHINPSMVVALVALVVATAGTATAAALIGSAQIRNNSIRSADIRNSTIESRDVRNRTLSLADISTSARNSLRGQQGAQGLQGAQGAQGAPGAAGSSVAFATLSSAAIGGDTIVDTKSKNVTDANVTHPANGVWCFNGLTFTPKIVIGTVLRQTGGAPASVGFHIETLAGAEIPIGGDPCPGTEQASALVFNNLGVLTDPTVGIAVLFE